MNTLHDDVARQAPQPARTAPSPQETNRHQDQSGSILSSTRRTGSAGASEARVLDRIGPLAQLAALR